MFTYFVMNVHFAILGGWKSDQPRYVSMYAPTFIQLLVMKIRSMSF